MNTASPSQTPETNVESVSTKSTEAAKKPWGEHWQHLYSLANLVVSIVGFICVLVSLNQTNKSLGWNIYASTTDWVLEVDKTFLEYPELLPYFDNGLPVTPADPNYGRAIATADILLDTFDSVLEQADRPPCSNRLEDWVSWINDSFDRSPILRARMEQHLGMYKNGKLIPVYDAWKQSNPDKVSIR